MYQIKEKTVSAEKISIFLKEVFHYECLAQDAKENSIFNLSVTPFYEVEMTLTEQEIVKSLLTSTQPSGSTKLRVLDISSNYLAKKNGDIWYAEPLLLQDEWLEQQKVHQAFQKIADAKGWEEEVEIPILCDCKIEWYQSVGWMSLIAGHKVCCLLQNGFIFIDKAEDEFPLYNDSVVNVADCLFNATLENKEIIALNRV